MVLISNGDRKRKKAARRAVSAATRRGTPLSKRATPSVSESNQRNPPTRRSTFVITHNHAIRDGMALAGEHKTRIDFMLLQRVVLLHAHFAFQHFRAARAAHTAFAGVRQREPRLRPDVEHAHALIRQAARAFFLLSI